MVRRLGGSFHFRYKFHSMDREMNTNFDSSMITRMNKVRAMASYQKSFNYANNNGTVTVSRGQTSNTDASAEIDASTGGIYCCGPSISSVNTIYVPNVQYAYFLTEGSTTWTAPATCVSPITYWMVGGGGGGGGAFDQGGAGGGGGGSVVTGSYVITPGQTYTIIVGAGGAGGQGSHSGSLTATPPNNSTHETCGGAGGASQLDSTNSGPQAPGGGIGDTSRYNPLGRGVGGTQGTSSVSSGGGGGGGGGGAGGGGGGAGGNGTNGIYAYNGAPGTGGVGMSLTIPGIHSGNPVTYGAGGNGGTDPTSPSINGTSAAANTGAGGQGGGSTSSSQASGGAGGSGLVVIQYEA